jgi:formylglycine-generating enzyme required for sulfatase activity
MLVLAGGNCFKSNKMDSQELRKQLLRERATGQIEQAEFEARMQALDEIERLESPAGTSVPDAIFLSAARGANQTVPQGAVPPPLAPGTVVDRFELVEFLGQGGMGQAWKAVDPTRRDDRRDGFVVLKFLTPALQNDAEALADFQTAYRRIVDLHHQNICPVYDLGQSRQHGCFQVMKFVPGISLQAYQRKCADNDGRLPLDRVVQLLRPIALALDHAHQQRLIHRDIKPGNIIVHAGDSGDVRDVQLIDFGLAAEMQTVLSRTSRVKMSTSGTLAYMAPEQWRGKFQDAATDQYALATLAFELLTGRLPFNAPNVVALGFAVLNSEFESDEALADSVDSALSRGLQKERKARFETCGQFVEALSSRREVRPKPQASPNADTPERRSPTRSTSTRPQAPQLLVAPFDSATGKLGQADCAASLGLPVEWKNSLGMAFRLIPPGAYEMGSAESEDGRSDAEGPQHKVRITRPSYLQSTVVTQGHWKQLMGTSPWSGRPSVKEGADYPALYVSWDDAVEFCRRLSQREGEEYRLPTEAEWEWACRAGSQSAYCFGDDPSQLGGYAWFNANANGVGERYAHRVGQKQANGFGLYDMHGNVWEWCGDWYGADWYGKSPEADPQGPATGSFRVYRGGSGSAPRGARGRRAAAGACPAAGTAAWASVCSAVPSSQASSRRLRSERKQRA